MKLGQVEVDSNIAQKHSSNPWKVMSDHYLKVKLGQVEVDSNIAQKHSSNP